MTDKPVLNWLGMPSHPTDGYANFTCTQKELEQVRQWYDDKDLENLLSWVFEHRSACLPIADEEMNNAGEGK